MSAQLKAATDPQQRAARFDELMAEYNEKLAAGWTPDMLGQLDYELSQANARVEESTALLESNEQAVADLTKEHQRAVNSMSSTSIVDALEALGDAAVASLNDAGMSVEEFAAKMAEAGGTAEMLNAVGSENFAALVAECNGDIDLIIQKILEFNGVDLDDKDADVQANGNVPDGSAKSAVEDTNKAISYLHDKEAYVNVYGNYGDASARIWDAVNAISNLASKSVEVAISAIASGIAGRHDAQGGILHRYHATGAIVHRPTQISTLDIAGEDGAEAIIPLTNKRYVTPFARTVADEFGASRDFEKLYAETLYARSVAESMAREMRRAMTGVQAQAQPGTHIDEVNINQRVVTQQDDIYVAAPAMARSAAREIRKLGR